MKEIRARKFVAARCIVEWRSSRSEWEKEMKIGVFSSGCGVRTTNAGTLMARPGH